MEVGAYTIKIVRGSDDAFFAESLREARAFPGHTMEITCAWLKMFDVQIPDVGPNRVWSCSLKMLLFGSVWWMSFFFFAQALAQSGFVW